MVPDIGASLQLEFVLRDFCEATYRLLRNQHPAIAGNGVGMMYLSSPMVGRVRTEVCAPPPLRGAWQPENVEIQATERPFPFDITIQRRVSEIVFVEKRCRSSIVSYMSRVVRNFAYLLLIHFFLASMRSNIETDSNGEFQGLVVGLRSLL